MNCERCPLEDTNECKHCQDKDPIEDALRKALEREERRISGKEKPIDERRAETNILPQ